MDEKRKNWPSSQDREAKRQRSTYTQLLETKLVTSSKCFIYPLHHYVESLRDSESYLEEAHLTKLGMP